MIAGYMSGYQRAGIEVTRDQVERQVIADCELVDSARSSGDMNRPGPSKGPKPKRPDPLAEAQQETGLRVIREGEAGRPIYSRAMHHNPMLVSERWGAAVARLARILQGGVEKRSTIVAAVTGGGKLAKLAAEYTELWGNYMFRHQPPPLSGKDHNPFRGLSDRDASQKFMRLVEDICDKSTGELGTWYTPK